MTCHSSEHISWSWSIYNDVISITVSWTLQSKPLSDILVTYSTMATPRKYISSFIAILILMFASSLEAAVARTTTPTHSSKAPKHTNKGKSDADICKMPFNHNNADQDKTTWNDSGAQDLLTTFLKEKGTKDWANNFLTKYAAGGTQGGTQYDCTSMWKSSCGPPADCLTYKPGSAFFVHTQMANLFGAFQTLYNRLVYDAVAAISTDIHQIVKEWGTPPKNQNDDIFQGLITALYTLAGIGATAETLGAGALAGDIGGPITIMAQVVGGIHMTDQPADPAALEAEIEDAYGQMFKSSVSSINSTVENIFNGFESKGKRQITGPTIPNPGEITNIVEENAIAGYFKDGKWLDNEINDAAINVYAKNMENKMVSTTLVFINKWLMCYVQKELALVQALKSGNKKGYCIAVYDVCDCLPL